MSWESTATGSCGLDHASQVDLLQLLQQQTLEHAVALLDKSGFIQHWNKAAKRVFGYLPQEICGKHISSIFTDFDNAIGAPLHEQQVALSVGSAEDDRWHVRKDGAKVWISGALTPLRNKDGQLLGYGKIMRDRTDARALTSTLENRINELVGQTQHSKEYFARLAHELRNSLAPVKNALRIVASGNNEQRNLAMTIMSRQIDVLGRLAHDAAELAAIHVGKLELSLAPIELSTWLPGVAAVLAEAAARKEQNLELLLVPGPVHIEADSQRLHQIVFNLLHNAVKYTPNGGRIWLKLTIEDKAAVIRVEDNGTGIDANLLPKILDLFTQASVSESEGGLGVGLSLVKDLVHAHEGSVEVRSDGLGKGSEFTVRLPMKEYL